MSSVFKSSLVKRTLSVKMAYDAEWVLYIYVILSTDGPHHVSSVMGPLCDISSIHLGNMENLGNSERCQGRGIRKEVLTAI